MLIIYNIRKVNIDEFKSIVKESHLNRNFSGDSHKMQIEFKTQNRFKEFIGIVYEHNDNVIGFCGLEIFETARKEIKGMIHCLGVVQNYRNKGLSKKLLLEVEKFMPDNVEEILTICNPISAKSHEGVGYIVTNPGRVTSTGKICMIRLKKVI